MKKPDPDEKLAKRFGVSTRTVRSWRAAGAPVDDEAALKTWVDGLGRAKPEHDPQSLAEARRAKIGLDIRRGELELAIRRSEFLPKAEVESAARAVGEKVKAVLQRFPQEAALLVGRDPAVAEERMKKLCDDAMRQLHDPSGYVTA